MSDNTRPTIETDEQTVIDGCKPALIVASYDDYSDPETLPSVEEVREVVFEAAWEPATEIHDIRWTVLPIQHEVPPKDPYPAYAVIITFGQMPVTDNNRFEDDRIPWNEAFLESPFLAVMHALYQTFEDIEIWIDGSHAGRPGDC